MGWFVVITARGERGSTLLEPIAGPFRDSAAAERARSWHERDGEAGTGVRWGPVSWANSKEVEE
jgi:hypothetical protein